MKKKTVDTRRIKKPVSTTGKTSETHHPANNQYVLYGLMMLVFIISVMVYFPVRNNDFITTWDDGVYVINNPLMHSLSWQNISSIFVYGDAFQRLINNYHPITTLSLAINYQVSGLSPVAYHTTNMVLHALNAVLVFLFIYLLSRRRLLAAAIAALLFAVHPMHVESVAWVSERKDVLYAFFFLAGLFAYLKYLEDKKIWKLGAAFILFLFSCLSKAMAVPFPLMILLIDYFQRRTFTWRILLEKIPFFILALIIGFMSVNLQSASAINKFETFSLFQRTMHASYGFINYLILFIWPSGLSAFYPYPAITPAGLLPLYFRIAPYIFLVIVSLVVWLATRKDDLSRVTVFGVLFFFFTIALVLQFLSVGKAIMADRYTYIPYIGLSLIIGILTDALVQKKSQVKYAGYGLAAITLIAGISFSVTTYGRTKTWKDDITLWTDVLRQFPDGRLNFVYEKRARQYLDKNQYEAALADYMIITSHDPRDEKALESIGRIYGQHYHDLSKAVEYLEKAYAINPKNASVLKSLGVAMGMKGDFKRSLDYLLEAYEIDKSDTTLVRNISASYLYLGMPEKAKEFKQYSISAQKK
ncbi:MAG: hypothetical protein NT040_12905 [Bacteroidetes bacterium]|nr:hypothetical protein [Bacteroidota bacterium]